MPQLHGDRLDRGPRRRDRVEELRVPVAGDHLVCRGWRQPERRTDVRLDPGVDIRVRPDRAGELADGHRGAGLFEPDPVALDLQREQGELCSERSRLGVHAVGAADDRRPGELDRAACECPGEAVGGADEEIGGATQRHREGRVDDVGRREPVVDPGALGEADRPPHQVDEGGDVVVCHAFTLAHRSDEGRVDHGCAPPDHPGRGGRHDAELGPPLDREQLDLEPEREPRLIAEQRCHLRECVTFDQPVLPTLSDTAMSPRY